jgi:hypothetical protein
MWWCHDTAAASPLPFLVAQTFAATRRKSVAKRPLAPYPKTAMTLLGKNKDSPPEQRLLRDGDGSEAGPSGTAPPSFEESAGHLVVTFDDAIDNFPAGGEEPPEFTPYEAEHWVSRSGEIISHDSHLNEDGVAIGRTYLLVPRIDL